MKEEQDAFDKISACGWLRKFRSTRATLKKNRKLYKRFKKFRKRDAKPDDWWTKYKKHLASEKWKTLKARLIIERGQRCERCGKEGRVDLHHLTYVRLGDELDEDLKLYCRACHDLMHAR